MHWSIHACDTLQRIHHNWQKTTGKSALKLIMKVVSWVIYMYMHKAYLEEVLFAKYGTEPLRRHGENSVLKTLQVRTWYLPRAHVITSCVHMIISHVHVILFTGAREVDISSSRAPVISPFLPNASGALLFATCTYTLDTWVIARGCDNYLREGKKLLGVHVKSVLFKVS